MNSPWIRTSLICGLALLLAAMGPGASVRLPRALTIGSEEEVRHAESQLIGSHATVQLRPAKRRGAIASIDALNAGRSASRVSREQNAAVALPRSLRALQIQMEV